MNKNMEETRMKFPNDADGDALHSLYKDGVDFKKNNNQWNFLLPCLIKQPVKNYRKY